MARIEAQRPLTASVLDRLLDRDPEAQVDPPGLSRPTLREIKAWVRRDLENLLNTRRRPFSVPTEYLELSRSTFLYGIPDLIASDFSTAESRAEFVGEIAEILRAHEPRFLSVKVVLLDEGESTERILRFRIEARMHAEPAPEQVVFDSVVEPVTRALEVRT